MYIVKLDFGQRHLPYKEMSNIRLFHVNKMAARFGSVNQQFYFHLIVYPLMICYYMLFFISNEQDKTLTNI